MKKKVIYRTPDERTQDLEKNSNLFLEDEVIDEFVGQHTEGHTVKQSYLVFTREPTAKMLLKKIEELQERVTKLEDN